MDRKLHRTKVIRRYKDIIVWFFICTFCRLSNCQNGIKLARKHFGIPLILNPEHLASSQLDELSCITYLSYFIKIGSPGYNATLQRVRSLLRNTSVSNFTVGWYKKKHHHFGEYFFSKRMVLNRNGNKKCVVLNFILMNMGHVLVRHYDLD